MAGQGEDGVQGSTSEGNSYWEKNINRSQVLIPAMSLFEAEADAVDTNDANKPMNQIFFNVWPKFLDDIHHLFLNEQCSIE